MEEKSREQEMSAREISLIRELAQIRKEYKRELEYEKFDGYELPPCTQFSMLNKPAVSIKYGVMKFNMACIRLFEGIKYVLPILHPNKKRLALIMCPEEDSAFVESRRKNAVKYADLNGDSVLIMDNMKSHHRHNEMLYHGSVPGTVVNLRRKRGEHHETGIPADGILQPPCACMGLQNHRLAAAAALVRGICGRAGYAGRRTGTAGAQAAAPGTGRQLPCRAAGF